MKLKEIVNFSKKVTEFVMDMIYGILKSKSCLISEISRSLEEKINLNYTIERLCDNLNNFLLFDDSDIAKPYGRKFEDLDKVIDASSIDGKVVSGYHVCEATILGKNQKQPIREILKYAKVGIKDWQKIEIREKYKQLELKL